MKLVAVLLVAGLLGASAIWFAATREGTEGRTPLPGDSVSDQPTTSEPPRFDPRVTTSARPPVEPVQLRDEVLSFTHFPYPAEGKIVYSLSASPGILVHGTTYHWTVADYAGNVVKTLQGARPTLEISQPGTYFVRLITRHPQGYEMGEAGAVLAADLWQQTDSPVACSSKCPELAMTVARGTFSMSVYSRVWRQANLPPEGELVLTGPSGQRIMVSNRPEFFSWDDTFVFRGVVHDPQGFEPGPWTTTLLLNESIQASVMYVVAAAGTTWPPAWPLTDGRVMVEPDNRLPRLARPKVWVEGNPIAPTPVKIHLRLPADYPDLEIRWEVFDDNATRLSNGSGNDVLLTIHKPGLHRVRFNLYNDSRHVESIVHPFSVQGLWAQRIQCPVQAEVTSTQVPCAELTAWIPRGALDADALFMPKSAIDPVLPRDATEASLALVTESGKQLGVSQVMEGEGGRAWWVYMTHDFGDNPLPAEYWKLNWTVSNAAMKEGNLVLIVRFGAVDYDRTPLPAAPTREG